MNDILPSLYDEYQHVLTSQRFVQRDLKQATIDRHIGFLEQLDVVSSSCISLFDMSRNAHVYHSPSFARSLGYDMERVSAEDKEYVDSRVHPEDLPDLVRNGTAILRYCLQLPVEKRRDCKLINEYRMLRADGGYVRVVEQMQALELDRRGNIWLALSLVDISPDQEMDAPVRSTIIDFTTGEIVRPPAAASAKKVLSDREIEVLSLVKEGLPSKEIAERLFISVHTVNTHRQRILEKLGVDNSFEAVRYAERRGITSYPDRRGEQRIL